VVALLRFAFGQKKYGTPYFSPEGELQNIPEASPSFARSNRGALQLAP
jgi:hypothetical protein